ncbi:MAG: hypothetical protein K0S65_4441 [Labilithrix sp.]|nr:hypothetical protein [Labilithrix sp.]
MAVRATHGGTLLALAIGLAVTFGVSDAGAVKNPFLQTLMKRLNEYAAAGNTQAAAEILKVVKYAGPDEYAGWAGIAERGRTAAAAGNGVQLKAACTACHDQYRAAYRSKYGSAGPDGR